MIHQKPPRKIEITILVIVAVIVAVFLIPKIIDWLYLFGPSRVNTTYTSKDLLSFWGAVLGGATVLLGVKITVNHNERMNQSAHIEMEEDRKRQIKPDLASSYKQVYDDGFIDQTKQDDYLIITLKSDSYPIYYSPAPPSWLKFERHKENTQKQFLSLQNMRQYLCIEYLVTNVGNDTAKNIEFKTDGAPAVSQFSLAKMSSRKFKLVIDLERFELGEEKIIIFIFDFLNIDDSVKYHALEKITVFKDLNDSLSSKQHPNDFLKVI